MVERLFLAVPWGCLRFVIVVFPDHTHLLFFHLNIIFILQYVEVEVEYILLVSICYDVTKDYVIYNTQ